MMYVEDEEMGVETPVCFRCRNATIVYVPVAGYAAWKSGVLIQEAFPTMPAPDREMLITGTHPECWNLMFGEED